MREKSELQKMLDGELYKAWNEELTAMRNEARQLNGRYNTLMGASLEERNAILKQLLGRCSSIDIQPPFFCDYGAHIFTGKNFFMNFNCVILDCAKVTIGDNVMCGPYVQIYTAYHPVLAAERIKGPELAAPVTIGNNVWLGGGAIRLSRCYHRRQHHYRSRQRSNKRYSGKRIRCGEPLQSN